MTDPYDPAPPYGADIERDPDYRKCASCGVWCCPYSVATTQPATYVCLDCRVSKGRK